MFGNGRPDSGPSDWADLYRAYQAFLATDPLARKARREAILHPLYPGGDPSESVHDCSAKTCVIFTWGDFHVCAISGDVHYCADVRTCPRRDTEDGFIICRISGAAHREDRLIVFGHVIGYAGSSAAITVGESRDGTGASGGRKRRRTAAQPPDDAPSLSRARLYNRARFCGALDGVTELIPTHIRDAIMTAGEFNADVLDGANLEAQALGLAHGGRGRSAAQPSVPSRARAKASARERSEREQQQDTENESDLAWLCEMFVRKDTEAVVARQESATSIRWRKAVNEHISDCISASQPVYLMPLLSYVCKLVTDSDRWIRAYRAIPARAVAIIREWLAARVRVLWARFIRLVRPRARSPLKYPFGYHALVIFYCSQSGIEWDQRASSGFAGAQPSAFASATPTPSPAPSPQVSRPATRWLLPPIPHLNVLLPSEKDLSNHSFGRGAQRTCIKKGIFTHTGKITRNFLYTQTPHGECATTEVDAPFIERLRLAEAEDEADQGNGYPATKS